MIPKKHVMILKVVLVLGLANSVFADGHHAYSEQMVKKFHDPHAHSGHHGELSHIGSHKPKHHEGYAWAYPAYEFSYKVEDHHTHDYKGQHETRDGDEVKGVYWLIQPDGKKRTVTYHADKHSGFHAKVEYSEPEHHIHHEKKHEDHVKHQPHHDVHLEENYKEHRENHKEDNEEHHKKYYSKPYGYYFTITHPKLYKYFELDEKQHEKVHNEHHDEVHNDHHEEKHEQHHGEKHEEHHEEKHEEHHEKHHIPHSNYRFNDEHPKYYGHYDNKHHYESNHNSEEPRNEYHHLEKSHHESEKDHYNKPTHSGYYIDHKILDDLREKAYQAFKIHKLNRNKEHHTEHQDHHDLRRKYDLSVYHGPHKFSHHNLPLSDEEHYGHHYV